MHISNFQEAVGKIFNQGTIFWKVIRCNGEKSLEYIYVTPEGTPLLDHYHPDKGSFTWWAGLDMINQCFYKEDNPPEYASLSPVQRKIRLMEQRFKTRHV